MSNVQIEEGLFAGHTLYLPLGMVPMIVSYLAIAEHPSEVLEQLCNNVDHFRAFIDGPPLTPDGKSWRFAAQFGRPTNTFWVMFPHFKMNVNQLLGSINSVVVYRTTAADLYIQWYWRKLFEQIKLSKFADSDVPFLTKDF